MNKGMAMEVVVKAVLAIGIAAIGMYFLLGPGAKTASAFFEYIGDQLGLNIFERQRQTDLLISAIKCSYFRCKVGC